MKSSGILRSVERLRDVQFCIAGLALVVMMMTIVIDVTLRFLFNHPISGAYDLVEICLATFVFHGVSVCFFTRKHIVIDLIDHWVPESMVVLLTRISDVVTVTLLGLMIWAMTQPALQAYDYGDKKLELGTPLWAIWAIALLGLAGAFVCSVAALFQPLNAASIKEH